MTADNSADPTPDDSTASDRSADSTRPDQSDGPAGSVRSHDRVALEDRLSESQNAALVDPLDPEAGEIRPIDNEAADLRILGQLRAQGVKIGRGFITPRVFWPSLIITAVLTIAAIALPDVTGSVLTTAQEWIVSALGWWYMLVVAIFIVFALYFGLSKYGGIRLGRDNEEPEFGLIPWFSMLFAAGMGVGLVFYGVAEPLIYATSDPKPGWEGGPEQLAKHGMAQTFIHWGLHPWSIYAIIGLALAYGIHRRGRPVSIRWALEPILGKRVHGWLGDAVDVVAVMGTIFGVATSLGLGVQQIAAGVQSMGLISEVSETLLVVLIVVITLLATTSVVSGLGKGIKWLSTGNLTLAGVLLISIIILGPTVFIFRNLVESLGFYLADFFNMTMDTATYTGDDGQTWASSWTLFYWGWWISWAPFVGVFIARISRGRTIREFIMGVIFVPTAVGFLWFSVMGSTGILRQLTVGDLWDKASGEGVVAESALFQVLNTLPLGSVLSVIAIILVTIFFITSSDSGSLVVCMLCSGGHPNPKLWTRVLWAFLEGAIAIALLLSGGLESIQAGALATALPFSIILLLMCFATLRSLKLDQKLVERQRLLGRAQALTEHVREAVVDDLSEGGLVPDEDWSDRMRREWEESLDNRIDYRIERTAPALLPMRKKNPPQSED